MFHIAGGEHFSVMVTHKLVMAGEKFELCDKITLKLEQKLMPVISLKENRVTFRVTNIT